MNQDLLFRFHSSRRDWFNFSLLEHRDFDGYMVSMHQSGTHWLKHMLSVVMSPEYGLPIPELLQDDSIIGHPKSPPKHTNAPRIVHSHTITAPVLAWPLVHELFGLPRYLILVRDPRAALVSHYEKWKDRYQVSFSEFLRGDPRGKRFRKDIWWRFVRHKGCARA